MKLIEGMTICYGLENLYSLSISNILVESDCLEAINLHEITVDISNVSLFIGEVTGCGKALGVVAYSHS